MANTVPSSNLMRAFHIASTYRGGLEDGCFANEVFLMMCQVVYIELRNDRP